MNINLRNAVSHFYPNSSYEQIYFEAVANAFDANATQVSILINISAFDQPDTLSLTISGNGEGFTDKNFETFSKLLETDNQDHKGLGRLVYLAYFNEVHVASHYGDIKKRTFVFSDGFAGKSTIAKTSKTPSGTELSFTAFTGDRIKSYNYLTPSRIKESLIEHFFPVFFRKKQAKEEFSIQIELQTDKPNRNYDFFPDKQTLGVCDVPELKQTTFTDSELDFFQQIEIHYSIKKDITRPKSAATAICIDGRTVQWDILPIECIPEGYQVLFLFISDYFEGKTDASRQNFVLPTSISEKTVKRVFRREINRIISSEMPVVQETNAKTYADLTAVYPHLQGYFSSDTVGLIVRQEVLRDAQESFFADQKQVLECAQLDEATYEKALAVSSRVLMEYILYRTRIIAKLKSMNIANSEPEIHDIIVMTYETFIKDAESRNSTFLSILKESVRKVAAESTVQTKP